MKTIEDYKSTLPQIGRLDWIGAAPARRQPLVELEVAELQPGDGIVGEHHANGGQSKREVTLIQAEHLPVVASIVHRESVEPGLLRRNLVVSEINLLALKDRRFRIGECILEGSGLCVPCSLMEYQLGPGGYNAMRGHGGITAIVIQGGKIRVGDSVVMEPGADSTKPADA